MVRTSGAAEPSPGRSQLPNLLVCANRVCSSLSVWFLPVNFAFLLVTVLAVQQTLGPGGDEGVHPAVYWPVCTGWARGLGGRDGSVQSGIPRMLSSADLSLLKHKNISRGELL